MLSEFGIVGFVLLSGLLAAMVRGLRIVWRPGPTLPRSQSAAAAGIVLVWLIHSATDWDWQLAAVTLPGIIAAAVTLAPRLRVR